MIKQFDELIVRDLESGELRKERASADQRAGDEFISLESGTFNLKTGRHVVRRRQIIGRLVPLNRVKKFYGVPDHGGGPGALNTD